MERRENIETYLVTANGDKSGLAHLAAAGLLPGQQKSGPATGRSSATERNDDFDSQKSIWDRYQGNLQKQGFYEDENGEDFKWGTSNYKVRHEKAKRMFDTRLLQALCLDEDSFLT